jgi:hypothetical protein
MPTGKLIVVTAIVVFMLCGVVSARDVQMGETEVKYDL